MAEIANEHDPNSALDSWTATTLMAETDLANDPELERPVNVALAVAESSAISGLEALKA